MERKEVFAIGDSVSIHYSPYLKEMIKSRYSFGRISELVDRDLDKPVGANAGDSNMVLEYIKIVDIKTKSGANRWMLLLK